MNTKEGRRELEMIKEWEAEQPEDVKEYLDEVEDAFKRKVTINH